MKKGLLSMLLLFVDEKPRDKGLYLQIRLFRRREQERGSSMKRKITGVILSVILSSCLLAGCGETSQSSGQKEALSEEAGSDQQVQQAIEESADAGTKRPSEISSESQNSFLGDLSDREGMGSAEEETSQEKSEDSAGFAAGLNEQDRDSADTQTDPGEIPIGNSLSGAQYVLIYDPLIYDEQDPHQMITVTSLDTGDISTQIVTGISRADDMELPDMPDLLSQDQLNGGADINEFDRSGDKAPGMTPIYSRGDHQDFNCFATDTENMVRTKENFECLYEGEHCYIWSWNDSISEEQAQELGIEFDQNIYQKDVDTFGPARFTEDGGKVSILMYPMYGHLGGFFYLFDLLSEGELSLQQAEQVMPNYGHAIINVNSAMMEENMPFVKSTLAHEFQHLICASDYFYYYGTPMMRTWLNEAMSAYAENLVYPGIKDENQYNQMMYLSNSFRTGQSLYNFSTENDEYIGAYGAVYLFSRFIDQKAGRDVFTKIHEYWRTTADPAVNEARALVSAVPESFYQEIDQAYDYPEKVSSAFSCPEEEWMSKLTLSFYTETLSGNLANLQEYEDAVHLSLLYSELNPQLIQGGGRMLVQTGSGSFTVPDSADSGLIYIGLDSDFHPIPGKMIVGQ